MKPNSDLKAELLDNPEQFRGEFFERFTLRPAPQPLSLREGVTKNYVFPTLYANVTCAIAIFFCSYPQAQALMPHPKVKPLNMLRGRSLVVISCYEYKNVRNIAPYNEIAMAIPVMVDPFLEVPILPLLLDGFKNFGYYVFSMPVTSLENEIRGHKIWGLPKVLQEIDIIEKDGHCVTIAKEGSGDPYFELRVPIDGKATDFDVSSYLYSCLDKQLLRSQTHFKATFNVRQYPRLLFVKDTRPEQPYLHLGEGPSARWLKQLELEPHPLQFRFARNMSSCFDLPDPSYRSPIHLLT